MDKWNMLPGALIEASPFHTTCFNISKVHQTDYVLSSYHDLEIPVYLSHWVREKRMAMAERTR